MHTYKYLQRLLLSLILVTPYSVQLIFAETSESATESQSEDQKLGDKSDEEQVTEDSQSKVTSRDIRKEQTTHLGFFMTPLSGIVQIGGDIDIIISDQWSVGVAKTYWENKGTEDAESIYASYGFHLKRYFGNSFYIKPSLGWHKYEKGWMPDPSIPDDGYELTEGIGLHVELGHDWSFNRYLGVGIVYFAIGPVFDMDNFKYLVMSKLPTLRLFGSF